MTWMIITEAPLRPSEKARAYKQQLDQLKRQGKRTDLSPQKTKHNSGQSVAEQHQESRSQIYRHIRLLALIPELLKLTDQGRMPLRTAVQLSFLRQEEQQYLWESYLSQDSAITLTQADHLKALSQAVNWNEIAVAAIMHPEQQSKNKAACRGKRLSLSLHPQITIVRKLADDTSPDIPDIAEAELEAVILTAVASYLEGLQKKEVG